MPDIPDLPVDLQPLRGVQMRQPPEHLIPDIKAVINRAAQELAEGEKGKVVWIAQVVNGEKTVNAAVINKIKDTENFDFTVTHWIGSTWGKPESAGVSIGTAGSISWR